MQVSTIFDKFSLVIKFFTIFASANLLAGRYAQLQQVHAVADLFSFSSTFAMSFAIPHFWTGLLVPICYLCTLWAGANFLQKFESSKAFTPELLLGLRSVGDNLMVGAMAALVLVPSLESWISMGGRSVLVNWEVEAVAIGMLGVILKLVARRAGALQRNIESIV